MTQSVIRTGIFAAALLGASSAFCQTAVNITGNWKIEVKDKPGEMEIYQAANDAYFGKIINDNNNPSKNGTIVLKELRYNKASQTYKGTMRPPDADIDLNVTVSVIDKNQLRMVAKKLLMSKTIYLTRIQ